MKILIVDDSPIDLSIINSAISKVEGVTTSFAKTADEAIGVAIRDKPDLIILDVVMPTMDGIEVKSRLSRTILTAHIPVIFVTGSEFGETKEDCYRIGCIDYLTKPIDMDKLVDIITRQSFITKLERLISDNEQFCKRVCG